MRLYVRNSLNLLYMPINFLNRIKLASSLQPSSRMDKGFSFRKSSSEHISGVYIFPCSDLKDSQPLFNDGHPSLILMPNADDIVELKNKGIVRHLKSAWVCCGVIQDTHWSVPDDLEYIMVVRFKHKSFYSIFDVDPAVFTSSSILSLEDITSKDLLDKIYQLFKYPSAEDRIDYMESIFSSFSIESSFPYALQAAIDYIEAKNGNTSVGEIVSLLSNVNQKWLHRNFRKYLGLSPKKYISLQRFIYAYGLHSANYSDGWLDTALLSGYYDYNHFFKEFKTYLGVAPTKHAWNYNSVF